MSKKPSFVISSKEKRLNEAKKELELENSSTNHIETKQISVTLDADLLYAAKEVALKRKRLGIEPSSISGMIRNALKHIVEKN